MQVWHICILYQGFAIQFCLTASTRDLCPGQSLCRLVRLSFHGQVSTALRKITGEAGHMCPKGRRVARDFDGLGSASHGSWFAGRVPRDFDGLGSASHGSG